MSIIRATAELFDPTGVTSLGQLGNARKIQWQEQMSLPGIGTFEIPLDDTITASITDRCIVKFSLFGAVRFACRISTEAVQLAVDGRRWLRFENQPGAMQMLGDAVVLPEYGLTRISTANRTFGYMSIDGAWRVPADWIAPTGYPFSAETIRTGYPPDLAIPDPDWIGYIDPETDQVPGVLNYFRREFTVAGTDPITVKIIFTADNFLDLWLDGDNIVAADLTQPWGWKTSSTVQLILQPGDHVLAAQVLNAVGGVGFDNPMGLIGVVHLLDTLGDVASTLLMTATTDWIVTDGTVPPGWTRAQVLKKLFDEATAAGCAGPTALTLGFSNTVDSDGNPWTDPPDQYSFPIATVNLADVAAQLSESGIDVLVDPDLMVLNCYVRKGTDKSGTVELKLGEITPDDGTLKSYETTSTVARFTDVITQLADGTWVETVDAGAVTAVGGHIQMGLALASTASPDTATNIALAQLAESAIPQIAVTGEPSALVGAQAYVDYDLGDTITVPAHRNAGTMKARVLAITVDATNDVVRAWPEFVPDGSV